jgi:hypothetical protein
MSVYLTWGADRALGETVVPGPLPAMDPALPFGTPSGNAIVSTFPFGYSYLGEEEVGSPEMERGNQFVVQHSFKMPWATATSIIFNMPKGSVFVDNEGNYWRVITSRLVSIGMGWGQLTVVSECLSADPPPDEFQITPMDMGIDILKHPRYFPNLYPKSGEFNTIVGVIKEELIRAIQSYRDSPYLPSASNLQSNMVGLVQNTITQMMSTGKFNLDIPNPNFDPTKPKVTDNNIVSYTSPIQYPPPAQNPGDTNDPFVHLALQVGNLTSDQLQSIQLAQAAAMEIITKLWRMEDTPYIPAVEIAWTSHFYTVPFLDLGARIEDPLLILPDYFVDITRNVFSQPPRGTQNDQPLQPPGQSLLDFNASENPMLYSSSQTPPYQLNLSCLRKADQLTVDNGLFNLTRCWICSVIGQFDPQLYAPNQTTPSKPSDYETFAVLQ